VFELPIELIERARPLPESIFFSGLSAVIAMRPRCERCRQHMPLEGFEIGIAFAPIDEQPRDIVQKRNRFVRERSIGCRCQSAAVRRLIFPTCAVSVVVLGSISARRSRQIYWEDAMTWKTPKIVEVPVGMEINMYACAARK
jgi:coenzyme PQQ precursor peptide PqqA